MRLAIVATLALCLNAGAAKAAMRGASVCYAGEAAFTIAAPEGWQIDNLTGHRNGLCTVLYPNGSSWSDGPAVMYPNLLAKGKEELAAVVRRDLDRVRQNSSDVVVADSKLPPGPESRAVVKRIHGKGGNGYQEYAYLDGKSAVIVVVLASKTQSDFERALPAFAKVVRSVEWIDKSSALKLLIALGKEDEARPESKDYRRRAMGSIGPPLANAMKRCTHGSEPGARFDLVLRAAADGTVDQIVATDGSALAACVKNAIARARIPPPPFAPYHLYIAMKAGL
jgi:hypothetical protein